MRAEVLLHKILGKSIHKSRVKLLGSLMNGLIKSKRLKLSALGRSLGKQMSERSGIRKVDRFLRNPFFQTSSATIYGEISRFTIGKQRTPILCVDWTKLPNVNEYALRVSMVAEGRAITLYEEVHPKKKEGNAKVHRDFLAKLKELLPKGCKPVILTDAGFKNPWFKAVIELGWDFIGRVKGKTCYSDGNDFQGCEKLHEHATPKPMYLGAKTLAEKNPLLMGFYIVRQVLKGRKRYTRQGAIRKDKDSLNYSRSHREPWLLVSSFMDAQMAEKVVALYKYRMTIEEAFRDMKSSQYGFSMEENNTQKVSRLIVWLVLNALASLVAWITGYTAEKKGLHHQFQANSIRHRRVLSYFYLGCQVIRKNLAIPIKLTEINFVSAEIFI